MKKVVIAIDSFKGCLPSVEAGKAAAEGIRSVYPECEVICLPIADGGEGMLDVLIMATNGQEVPISAHDPLMRWRNTYYGISEKWGNSFHRNGKHQRIAFSSTGKKKPDADYHLRHGRNHS